MLCHTFCHLPGIAAKTEQRLWSAGLTTWQEALAGSVSASAAARRLQAESLRESMRRHDLGEVAWFGSRLPAAEAWRLFSDFRGRCAYLDIETTGMSSSADITTIALYDGQSLRTYVRGHNLQDFARDIQGYPLLVTYNGKCFDVPVLGHGLGCRLDQAHIDLRYILAGLGLRGGLKACEQQLGMTRPGMEQLDGFAAVLLWRRYTRNGDSRALETLLAYNAQDALNLEVLMVHAHNACLKRLAGAPFASRYQLAAPTTLANPFTPDPETVRRVSGSSQASSSGWA